MENRDARTLGQEAQEELRRQAIGLLKKGLTQQEVADQCEVSRRAVGKWWVAYREGGWKALQKKRRGRNYGEKSKLTLEQQREIQKVISDKTPDQLRMKFALWSREAVQTLIRERYKVVFSRQHVGSLLKRWGFTAQRPLKKAYEQRPAEVQRWMQQTYPKVVIEAKKQNAEIWWADETAVKPECHYRRGYSPKGKTPQVRQPARRFHSSVISAINNQGKMQWMALKEALNAQRFIEFLKKLIKHRRRKLILIVDNLRVHHSKLVKEWVQQNKERLELVFLPPYSPELNPDEYLNNHLKQTVTKDGPSITVQELEDKVWLQMILLADKPDLVASFFRHPAVQYAAA